MAPDKQNKRGCAIFALLLTIVAALILWASLGGVSGETTADDTTGGVNARGVAPKL